MDRDSGLHLMELFSADVASFTDDNLNLNSNSIQTQYLEVQRQHNRNCVSG